MKKDSVGRNQELVDVHGSHDHFSDQKLDIQLKFDEFFLETLLENVGQFNCVYWINVDADGSERCFASCGLQSGGSQDLIFVLGNSILT